MTAAGVTLRRLAWRVALLAGLGLGAGATMAAPPPAAVRVTITPKAPHPGDVVLVELHGAPAGASLEWGGRAVPTFPVRDGAAALAGIDLDTAAGPLAWRVTAPPGAGGPGWPVSGAAVVQPKSFPVQRLTLPPNQVDLDPATLARVEAESRELKAALADGAGERLWHGAFLVPVEGGRPTGGFGLRRILNGQPRSPHTGFDWAAPVGTPILASNAGRVVLVADHFFAGRNVVVDHGLGLFTFYFHMSEVHVAAGDAVAAGQVLGAVGVTGRVTGAHLHFAVLLGGARVDPESLLSVAPPADPAS